MRALANQIASTLVPVEHDSEGRFEHVDTSLLLEELRRVYHSSRAPVHVDMRQLVSWLKAGDQATHFLHPYPGKLLSHIAHFFVHASVLNRAKKPILDPFCGSGTVALEASLAGIESYIADANPFAVLLAAVKSYPYSPSQLQAELDIVLRRARAYKAAPEIDIVNPDLWYHPTIKEKLERLRRAVGEIGDERVRAFFLISFSATAKKLSYADPAISVPVKLRTKSQFSELENRKIIQKIASIETSDVFFEFQVQAKDNILRIQRANAQQLSRKAASVVGADCRKLHAPGDHWSSLPSASVTLTITSPPYGSAQKYIRATSLGLNWIGFADSKKLAELESRSIGREHVKADTNCAIPDDFIFKEKIDRIARRNPVRAAITWEYFQAMSECVEEISRVTAPGGTVVMVVGNNQVAGEVIENDAYLIDEFKARDFTLDLWLLDKIRARRLMRKRHPTAAVIDHESILVFRKQSHGSDGN